MTLKALIGGLAAAWLAVHGNLAGAVGTLIPAANRADMVHDAQRKLVYITDGDRVLRYHEPSGAFIDPIVLGGQLAGLDLSPDGATLAVADRSSSAAEVWVHLVRLDDLSRPAKLLVPKAFYEDGTWAAAFAADGGLLVTSRFAGSGWVPLRRFSPGDWRWSEIASVRQDTMLAASGDGKTVAFAEANSSDGPWGTYDPATGSVTRRQGYQDGTSWFNYEIAAQATGKQFAIPTYGGTFIYDGNFARVATLGQYAGARPIAAAYHPVENLIYFPWAQTREVKIYDTATLAPLGSLDFEDTFPGTGNAAFQQGRTRLSWDGSLLMVAVTGGVRILRQYAPLTAAPVAAGTNAGTTVSLALKGSIGNQGKLSYSILQQPVNGTVQVNGALATYTPKSGFAGTDSFVYQVHYGKASASANAAITVTGSNRPPVARDDAARTPRNTPVAIPVLANDSDPDQDPLAIAGVAAASAGTVTADGAQVLYTPPRNYQGDASFSYTVSDGRGGSASARVVVSVGKR